MVKADRDLQGFEMLVCVTGGIACYKAADLVSKLMAAQAGVSVAMTDSAARFVAPLTFQGLTMRQVFTSTWQSSAEYDPQHLSLTERADLMIVAPATANILAKMAAGIADDLVSTLALSAQGSCPILVVPAMNTRMWQARPTQANLQKLRDWGIHVIGPNTGRLACGESGPGRMAEPLEIVELAKRLLGQKPKSRQ